MLIMNNIYMYIFINNMHIYMKMMDIIHIYNELVNII